MRITIDQDLDTQPSETVASRLGADEFFTGGLGKLTITKPIGIQAQ
jgi:hypothetical protein